MLNDLNIYQIFTLFKTLFKFTPFVCLWKGAKIISTDTMDRAAGRTGPRAKPSAPKSIYNTIIRSKFCGDLHKNNSLWEMTLRSNYFTYLTLLCGALAKAVTPVFVAPWEWCHTLSAGRLEPSRMTECVAFCEGSHI
jgi:hypothetical protein